MQRSYDGMARTVPRGNVKYKRKEADDVSVSFCIRSERVDVTLDRPRRPRRVPS